MHFLLTETVIPSFSDVADPDLIATSESRTAVLAHASERYELTAPGGAPGTNEFAGTAECFPDLMSGRDETSHLVEDFLSHRNPHQDSGLDFHLATSRKSLTAPASLLVSGYDRPHDGMRRVPYRSSAPVTARSHDEKSSSRQEFVSR